jgi:DNA-directed RNA polymerase specialized sigma24 family protein
MSACEVAVTNELQSRDARRVNHMDPETKIVHGMLEAWGAWAKDSEIRAYPAATYLHRWAKEGIHGASQEGRPPVSMPDEIAAVDAAVCRLNATDKKAVQIYYIKWQSAEVSARAMHMRVRQYQNVLRRARWRLALFLNLL